MKRETYEKQRAFAGELKPSMKRRAVDNDYHERRIYLAKLTEWANNPTRPKGGIMGDWIFQDIPRPAIDSAIVYKEPILPDMMEDAEQTTPQYNDLKEVEEPLRTQSLTTNAIQLNWKNPVTFPCCPQQFTGEPLEAYIANLEEGKVFSTNSYGDSTVLRFGKPQSDCLWVMCSIRIGWKTHAFTKITFDDGIFYHENKGVYDIGDEPEEMFESILNGEEI